MAEREDDRVQTVAPEEGDDAAEGEKRCERNRHLARPRPVAREKDDRQGQRRDDCDDHADGHGAAEHGAQQERELDVAHAHTASIDEGGGE